MGGVLVDGRWAGRWVIATNHTDIEYIRYSSE